MTETERLKSQIAALESQIARVSRGRTVEELDELSAAYARADSVAAHFGQRAPDAMPGETPLQYRRRLANNFKQHSEQFARADLSFLDSATLAPIETAIFDAAKAKANDSASYPPGTLIPIRERDEAGRLVTRWVGDPMVWMAPFCTAARRGYFVDPDKNRR